MLTSLDIANLQMLCGALKDATQNARQENRDFVLKVVEIQAKMEAILKKQINER